MALFSAEISTKQMVPVCRQLATAYEAGIPIIRSIDHVAANTRDAKAKRVFSTISEDLRNGHNLTDAVRKHTRYLGPFFVNLMAAGEQGGRLDVTLKDLADYYEDRLTLQRQIAAATFYPIFLLGFAWFAGSFAHGLLNNTLNEFAGRGGGSGTGLITEYLGEYVRFQTRVMSLVAIVAVIFVILARMGMLKYAWGWFTTHIWPISRVTRNFGMARFFRSFSLLMSSGIDVNRAIRASATVTSNPYIERDLLQAVPAVKQGATLVEAFAGSRMMTPLAREMLAIGEESGNLEQHLKKAAQYHADEASQAVKLATAIGIRILVLGVMIYIGYIVISFYAKLFGGIFDGLGV